MKKYLFILLAMLTMSVSLSSCGSDDDDSYETPTRITPTITEIQGTWGFESQFNYYYSFTFEGNKFTFAIYDTTRKEIDEYAGGTYTISGGKLCLTRTYGDSKFHTDEIYWTSSSKSYLHIEPLGDFIKVK